MLHPQIKGESKAKQKNRFCDQMDGICECPTWAKKAVLQMQMPQASLGIRQKRAKKNARTRRAQSY